MRAACPCLARRTPRPFGHGKPRSHSGRSDSRIPGHSVRAVRRSASESRSSTRHGFVASCPVRFPACAAGDPDADRVHRIHGQHGRGKALPGAAADAMTRVRATLSLPHQKPRTRWFRQAQVPILVSWAVQRGKLKFSCRKSRVIPADKAAKRMTAPDPEDRGLRCIRQSLTNSPIAENSGPGGDGPQHSARLGGHGRGGGARTPDPRFWRPMLFQLSYTPMPHLRF